MALWPQPGRFAGQSDDIMEVSRSLQAAVEWRSWSDVPGFSRTSTDPLMQLAVHLLEGVVGSDSVASYLKQRLPDVSSEFGASWIAVVSRNPGWERLVEFGRMPLEQLPTPWLAEVLDRDAGSFRTIENTSSGTLHLAASPLRSQGGSRELLLLAGRSLSGKSLSGVMGIARAVGWAVDLLRPRERAAERIERLHATLRIASQLSEAKETTAMLELIASEAARLLGTDRSSIFVWDKEHQELVGCPALGVEGNVLRIPDRAGIVGECLHEGHAIRVDDAYQDSRFNKKVDEETGYKTRNLLCVPLLNTADERVGVFEVINKLKGRFTEEDEESLHLLGIQAAAALPNTREKEHLVRRNKQLTAQVTQGVNIIGNSPAIVALRGTISRLASTDLPVLILGESGTGKEVVAQSLHYGGPRHDQPFIAVNCAALTETLLESELFGHEKGAFTDAREARQGKFELADGGTLFLDEIGDMSPGGQAKLLRVLEQKVITRVGGSATIRTNVRVVAATNAKLAQAVRDKKFREDLYYRLSVVALDLHPLRERPEDILPLAEFFLDNFSIQAGRRKLVLSNDARRRLQSHNWPGNVRELRNLMERVAFLAPKETVESEDLAFILSPERGTSVLENSGLGLAEATSQFQQEYIRRLIKRCQGNMTDAASRLGLHRSNLYRKMRQLKMTEAEGIPEELEEIEP